MDPRERHLRGAGEIEVVVGEPVDVRALGGEEAGADHRLLADEHGRDHGQEPVPGEMVERGAVEREREQGGVADQVAEAGTGEPSRALHVEAPDLRVLLGLRDSRWLADSAQLLRVLVAPAVGRRLVGRVRHLREGRVACRLGRGELRLGGAELLLDALKLGELLRRGLALQLRPASELVDARDERPPALVGLEHRVERVRRSLARERRPVAVRVVPRCFQVDHALESRKASSVWATPSSSAGGQSQSARAFSSSKPFSTETA